MWWRQWRLSKILKSSRSSAKTLTAKFAKTAAKIAKSVVEQTWFLPFFASFARPLRALRLKAFAISAAVLLILFDDEMIGHAGDVVADYPRQGFLVGFLLVIVRQG